MASKPGDIVVIAVDPSPFSQNAFQWYLEHMHKNENKVILVHCLEFPSIPSRETWEQQTRAGREKGIESLSTYLQVLNERGVNYEIAQEFEKPGEYICQVARQKQANVIVMGTRGMGKLRRTILGSVSNYVLNHAYCPVLVCRCSKDMDQ